MNRPARMLSALLALPLLALVLAVLPTPAAAAPVYVVGGELHVGDGTVLRKSVIEIDPEKGTFGQVREGGRPPGGVTVIDASGKTITPGFIAADAAIGLVEIDLEPSTRDDVRKPALKDHPEPINASFDASLAVHEGSSLIQIQAVEGITTAAVAPKGGMISGQVAWVDLLYGRVDLVAQARVAIDGALGQAYRGSRAATLAKLAETLSDARRYAANKGAYDRGSSRPLAAHHLDLEALGPLLRGRVPLTVTANRASDIRAALELATRFKIKIVIVGGAEAWKVAEQLAAAKVPVVLRPTSNLPGSLDRLGARLDAAALLDRAGVTVVIADPGGAHNLRNIGQEAGVAVAHGLPWEKALSAVTRNVAVAYGMDADYGTVATGKVANLVIWSGDPFELSTRTERVFIRGAAIPMVSRQTLLRDRYRDLGRFRR